MLPEKNVKIMEITEILRRIRLFSTNKIKKNSESFSKQSTSLWQIIDSFVAEEEKLLEKICMFLPQM